LTTVAPLGARKTAVGATAAIFARNALVPPAGVGWNAFLNGKFAERV
jgi:hypothetical protein